MTTMLTSTTTSNPEPPDKPRAAATQEIARKVLDVLSVAPSSLHRKGVAFDSENDAGRSRRAL